MTMKNNAKFEEELTFHFKTDMRNLINFDSSTQKSKKIAFSFALYVFKKAIKLDSFLQCPRHLFLGHDGCFKN